jgi:hypothetical protein
MLIRPKNEQLNVQPNKVTKKTCLLECIAVKSGRNVPKYQLNPLPQSSAQKSKPLVNVKRLVNSRKMRWTGHMARTDEKVNACKIFL